MLILLEKGSTKKLAPNFTADEFYSNSPDVGNTHPFYSELVEAAQLLRDHFDCPWRITSTYRTPKNELAICAINGLSKNLAYNSQHVLGRAFDSQPAASAERNKEIMAELAADFTEQGPLFKKLRKLGINGFGLYNTFIHLDNREQPGKHLDQFGRFAAWDERKNVKKKLIGAAARTLTQQITRLRTPAASASLR